MLDVFGSLLAGLLGGGTTEASRRSQEAQIAQNKRAQDFIEAAAKQARTDAQHLFGQSQLERNAGYQGAMNLLQQSLTPQISAMQQGNVAAQNAMAGGLPQIQNALMGMPIDYSSFAPQQIAADTSFLPGPSYGLPWEPDGPIIDLPDYTVPDGTGTGGGAIGGGNGGGDYADPRYMDPYGVGAPGAATSMSQAEMLNRFGQAFGDPAFLEAMQQQGRAPEGSFVGNSLANIFNAFSKFTGIGGNDNPGFEQAAEGATLHHPDAIAINTDVISDTKAAKAQAQENAYKAEMAALKGSPVNEKKLPYSGAADKLNAGYSPGIVATPGPMAQLPTAMQLNPGLVTQSGNLTPSVDLPGNLGPAPSLNLGTDTSGALNSSQGSMIAGFAPAPAASAPTGYTPWGGGYKLQRSNPWLERRIARRDGSAPTIGGGTQ